MLFLPLLLFSSYICAAEPDRNISFNPSSTSRISDMKWNLSNGDDDDSDEDEDDTNAPHTIHAWESLEELSLQEDPHSIIPDVPTGQQASQDNSLTHRRTTSTSFFTQMHRNALSLAPITEENESNTDDSASLNETGKLTRHPSCISTQAIQGSPQIHRRDTSIHHIQSIQTPPTTNQEQLSTASHSGNCGCWAWLTKRR